MRLSLLFARATLLRFQLGRQPSAHDAAGARLHPLALPLLERVGRAGPRLVHLRRTTDMRGEAVVRFPPCPTQLLHASFSTRALPSSFAPVRSLILTPGALHAVAESTLLRFGLRI
eukprot:6064300-Pleurochrysis_carterae.AAC.1